MASRRKVHSDRYVVETPTGLPDSELTAVTGETVCQAGGVVVWPLAGFPDSRVSTASEHLVRKHKTGWPMGRILQQVRVAWYGSGPVRKHLAG